MAEGFRGVAVFVGWEEGERMRVYAGVTTGKTAGDGVIGCENGRGKSVIYAGRWGCIVYRELERRCHGLIAVEVGKCTWETQL